MKNTASMVRDLLLISEPISKYENALRLINDKITKFKKKYCKPERRGFVLDSRIVNILKQQEK